jgi:hypothetical protein
VSVNFAIYASGEVAPTLTPALSISGESIFFVDLKQDPLSGTYDLQSQPMGRGSRFQTIGGVVIQDFGVVESDRVIHIATETSAITSGEIAELQQAYETVDGTYYFTDSLQCWKVQFARPGGFMYSQNMKAKFYNKDLYDYELTLYVLSKEI